MQYTTNSDRTVQLTASHTSSRSDTTVAVYTAMRLEAACARLAASLTSCEAVRCVNLASAIKRSRETGTVGTRIAPKGRTLYSVRRGN